MTEEDSQATAPLKLDTLPTPTFLLKVTWHVEAPGGLSPGLDLFSLCV